MLNFGAKVEADFKEGFALPAAQTEKNRVTRLAAHAFMAKAYLYDGSKNWDGVKAETEIVISSGKFKLVDHLEFIYSLPEHNWDGENVFAIYPSVQDGTANGELNLGIYCAHLQARVQDITPMVMDFTVHQDLVNNFQVDANGLPFGIYTHYSSQIRF